MPPDFSGLKGIAITIAGILCAIIIALIWFNTRGDEVRLQERVKGLEPDRIEVEEGWTSDQGRWIPADTTYIYNSKDLK